MNCEITRIIICFDMTGNQSLFANQYGFLFAIIIMINIISGNK